MANERVYFVGHAGRWHEVTAFNAMWAVDQVIKRANYSWERPTSPCTVVVKETKEQIKVTWGESGWHCEWTPEQEKR